MSILLIINLSIICIVITVMVTSIYFGCKRLLNSHIEYIDRKKRSQLYKHTDLIMRMFDKAKESAYQKIFRDKVMVQLSSGFKINMEELSEIQNEYIKIVFMHCGENIMSDVIELYGDMDSLCAYLAVDLSMRIASDEASMLTNWDEDTETS